MEDRMMKLRIIVADARDRNPDMVLPYNINEATYLQLNQSITQYMLHELKNRRKILSLQIKATQSLMNK